MKKILLATDGSDSAMHAASVANQWMEAWPEAKLEMVYVTQVYSAAVGSNISVDFAEELARDVEARFTAAFEGKLDRVAFSHVTDVASPAIVLSRIAEQDNFDMIIVGSHGRSAINRMVLGSVSHGLVNRAKVPVLVVRN
ncbi:MAG: hypothetical protein A2201_08645 [Alicyclobacillus sp. RIFOXYA1_FULL_53_8]|nr:MAG: hypothetical protein A2201_08645 [Alicyclobacillus sp. RIFOXYA1_FULL_53_8]